MDNYYYLHKNIVQYYHLVSTFPFVFLDKNVWKVLY